MAKGPRHSGSDKERFAILSSMQKKALILIPLLASVAGAAAVAPRATLKPQVATDGASRIASQPAAAALVQQPAATAPAFRTSNALAQWNSLRQSDRNSFSAYASFLTRYRGWPGENGLRRSAEKAIPPTANPAEVINYFRILPPLTAVGHARHAFALQAAGQADAAQAAARTAWRAGALPPEDETRLVAAFGRAFSPDDNDNRLEKLLAQGDTSAAQRVLAFTSPARRPYFEARMALRTRAPDASARVDALGAAADADPGLLADRARWMRDNAQVRAARALLGRPRTLASRPVDPETWYETLLEFARGAANDKQWSTAYQIASQIDDAYPPGTDISQQSLGERDDYTSLAWLAGTVALHELNRPNEAAAMFVRYANGGRSAQVTTKGFYWAGRAALAAGKPEDANRYFAQAAVHPELFYGQLALERLGRPVPAPAPLQSVAAPTPQERSAFQNREIVQAVRLLGQMGQWQDQSLFIRTLSEQAESASERAMVTELSGQLNRPDLAVWMARSARNAGSPFYVRAAYPEISVPPSQNRYWSLAHGIIRQESSFDRAAVSHAGARGMMQLMPPTARQVSGKLGVGYDFNRLTRDPEYNVLLGCHYFAGLMDSWGGYAPLAIASYNAGPGNVRKWVAANGDPRRPGVDIVKWIEEIPFAETRGYVQRVLENAVVYDTIQPARAGSAAPMRLSHYLGKGGRPG